MDNKLKLYEFIKPVSINGHTFMTNEMGYFAIKNNILRCFSSHEIPFRWYVVVFCSTEVFQNNINKWIKEGKAREIK